ncbi:MAG: DUF4864 domain-containing protein [Reyranellaceae bacterium]
MSVRPQALAAPPFLAAVLGPLLGLFLAVAATLAQAPPAAAQDVSAADRQAFRQLIESQIEAFRRDDGEAAFGVASPAIRQMFGTSEIFMDMVRQGYQPVYRPRSVEFGEIVSLNGQPAQKVHLVAPDGRPVTAVYPMTRLPDGTWRIDGCYLEAPQRRQA